MDMSTTSVISVTEQAARKAAQLAANEGRSDDACLRVRVVAGGCSGFSYELGFEDAPAPDDHVIDARVIRILVDPRSIPIVEGSTLDFNDALLGGGLRMINPRATHECACGDSFSV